MQNLVRALGRDNRRRLLLTLDGWVVAQTTEFGALAELSSFIELGCELFVTFGQR